MGHLALSRSNDRAGGRVRAPPGRRETAVTDQDAPTQPRRGVGIVLVAVIVGVAGWYAFATGRPPAVNDPETQAVPEPDGVYDPVAAGAELPRGYVRALGRDWIEPIYQPRFRSAAETDWSGETLVLGAAQGDEAKAYPIRVLNHREMVLDRLGGTPILATW